MSTTVAVHVPAWKRVGLKLKSVEAVAGVGEAPPPLPTPEVKDPGVVAAGEGRGKKKEKKEKKKEKKGGKAPEDESEEARKERKKKKKERKEAEKEKEKEKETKAEPDKDKDKPTTPKNPCATKSLLRTTASASTLRKSVTFTSDTKATDGDSIKTLYQNHDPFAHYDSYQQHLANYPVNELPAGFDDPPAPAQRAKKEKDTGEQGQAQAQGHVKYKFESTGKRKKFSDNDDDDDAPAAAASGKDTTAAGATTTTTPPAPASKKRKTAPATTTTTTTTSNTLSHLTYLRTHHDQRASWRFEKAKQNWILRHALDPALIPATHGDALAGYVAGLQGAGARDRLLAAANDVVKRGADTVGRDGERVDVLLQRAGVERARLVLAALGHAEDDDEDDDDEGSEDGSE